MNLFVLIKSFPTFTQDFNLCDSMLPTKKKRDSMNSELLKMACYTKEQRVFIVVQYFKNNEDFSTNDF